LAWRIFLVFAVNLLPDAGDEAVDFGLCFQKSFSDVFADDGQIIYGDRSVMATIAVGLAVPSRKLCSRSSS